MKLKNLTIGKLKEICTINEECAKCPLNGKGLCSIAIPLRNTQILEEEIFLKQPKRKYYVKFTKCNVFMVDNNGEKKVFQDNCGFCVKDLHSYSIKRPFDSNNIIVENLVVKEIKTNKIIYQGESYEEYLKVIGEKTK